jgi:MFS family permease
MGLAIGFSANVWLTSAQNIVPAGMRGRYFAIDGVLSFVAGPPAIVAGAFLIQAIGVASEFILAGLLMLVSALVFGLMRNLWRLDGRTRVDSGST